MGVILQRVALVSMHTSPVQQPGTGDSGGLNVSLMALAGHLADRGLEVELLTRAVGAPRTIQLGERVSLHELPAGEPGVLAKADAEHVSDEFGEAVAERARSSSAYDLIHAHYWLSGVATLPVAIELGIPFVQSFHTLAAMKNENPGSGQAVEPQGRLRAEAYLAGQASAVIASSRAEAVSLIDQVGAAASKVWVIPPGVDTELFRPDRPDADARVRGTYGIEPGVRIIVVVGRVQPLKGQELAIRAFAELGNAAGKPAVLLVAGEATPGDEPYLWSLRALAEELGVGDSVLFVGALGRDALADLLATASATLVPSHSETFGLVALESAASGTPAIGYRKTGLTEAIAEGASGMLLPNRVPEAWAAALASVLDDSHMAVTAREHALDFTWAASAAALLGVYSTLLG